MHQEKCQSELNHNLTQERNQEMCPCELNPSLTWEMNQERCLTQEMRQEMSELNTNLAQEMHQYLHHNSKRGAPTPYSPSLK